MAGITKQSYAASSEVAESGHLTAVLASLAQGTFPKRGPDGRSVSTQRWNQLLYQRFAAGGFPEVRPSYGSVLIPLYDEDGLRIGEIARRARLSKQTMTTMIRLLERHRLVERRADPRDGRASRVFLTRPAQAFRPVAEAAMADLERLAHTTLTASRTEELAAALRELTQTDDEPARAPGRASRPTVSEP